MRRCASMQFSQAHRRGGLNGAALHEWASHAQRRVPPAHGPGWQGTRRRGKSGCCIFFRAARWPMTGGGAARGRCLCDMVFSARPAFRQTPTPTGGPAPWVVAPAGGCLVGPYAGSVRWPHCTSLRPALSVHVVAPNVAANVRRLIVGRYVWSPCRAPAWARTDAPSRKSGPMASRLWG